MTFRSSSTKEIKKSAGKFIAMFLFKDEEGMLMIIFRKNKLLKLKTILMKEEWQRKLWECGFFLPDDALAHIASKTRCFEGFRVWVHRPFTLFNRSCPIWLFPNLKIKKEFEKEEMFKWFWAVFQCRNIRISFGVNEETWEMMCQVLAFVLNYMK